MRSLRACFARAQRLLGLGAVLGLMLTVAPLALGQSSNGEADTAKPEKSPDQKISEILKQIEELRKEVETLQGQKKREVAKGEKSDETKQALPASWIKALKWRGIGPANMGGRITAISVYEADPSIYWIATASGGLLKTTNNGVTFEHQFDREATVSIGDVCVAPSDPNIVWLGTGENNPRNSVSYGDGVYKSTDGGKTWKNMGLKKTFQIGRVIVHPRNPDIVYIGALGRLYGTNEDRGLYKTTDGGKNWDKVLYVDDKTGVIDIAMSPAEPETLLVAMWERQRDGFDSHRGEPRVADGYDAYDPIKKWGPGSGIYKTTDGGKNWRKLNASPGSGLPSNPLGRVDIDFYRKEPNTVYAIIDCEKIGMGLPPNPVYLGVQGKDGGGGAQITRVSPKSPSARAELKADDVIKSVDKTPIKSYAELTELLKSKKEGDKLSLEIVRGDKTETVEVTLENRPLSAMLTGGGGTGAAYLGAQGEDGDKGVLMTQVLEGSPAGRAGLKSGDLIKSVDKEPMSEYTQFLELVRTHQPGDRLAMEVLRDDKTIPIVVTLEERPNQFGGLNQGLAALLGVVGENGEGGVRVVRLFEDRVADKAGIQEDDLLKELDGKPIASTEQLTESIGEHKEGDKITITLVRDNAQKQIQVTLEAPGGGNRNRPYTFMYAGQQPNVQEKQGPNSHEYGGIFKSTDAGDTWTRINSLNPRPMYFSQIRVDPSDDKYLYVLGISLHRSKDGGKTFQADGGRGVHADQHALWIDPKDGRHMVVGCDGGFYVSYDRAGAWEHLNHMAIGQFYHVALDSRQPYRVYGGLQDNGSWGGPSRGLDGSGPVNQDWISVGGGDGFVCRVDPFDPDVVYSESQDGNVRRYNIRTGARGTIRPRAARGQRFRFNWNTPFIVSSHNPGIIYSGGNYVFRSVKHGEDLKVISPEIARTGRGTATAIAESPRNPDVLWAGTDDGNLWVSRDGGQKWTNVAEKVGLPGPRWVATIEPSRAVEGRCYVAFDGHRSDDDDPYIYVTEDFGETWKSIRANLPWGSTRCLREDLVNADLLFCGTEFGAWASIDRGVSWTKINNNLPTVAVHELAIHPTAGEMVAATHGRSIWIVDITPLRQMTTQVVQAPVHLYEPNAVVRWRIEPSRGDSGGTKHFTGENPPRTASIYYSLAKKAEKVALKVVDINGTTVRELTGHPEAGLNVVSWDLSRAPTRPGGGPGRRGGGGATPGGAGERRGEGTAQPAAEAGPRAQGQAPGGRGGGGGGRGGFGRGGGQPIQPGVYRVVLVVDGKESSQTIRVEADPTLPESIVAYDQEPEEDEEEEEQEMEAGPIGHIDD